MLTFFLNLYGRFVFNKMEEHLTIRYVHYRVERVPDSILKKDIFDRMYRTLNSDIVLTSNNFEKSDSTETTHNVILRLRQGVYFIFQFCFFFKCNF